MYRENITKLNRVQAKVMPFMVSVQKAQSDYNENKAKAISAELLELNLKNKLE